MDWRIMAFEVAKKLHDKRLITTEDKENLLDTTSIQEFTSLLVML